MFIFRRSGIEVESKSNHNFDNYVAVKLKPNRNCNSRLSDDDDDKQIDFNVAYVVLRLQGHITVIEDTCSIQQSSWSQLEQL